MPGATTVTSTVTPAPSLTARVGELTHGGSSRDPAWVGNLMAHPEVTVEMGTRTVPATARLARGEERGQLWAKEVALVPKFAGFEATAGRQVPVVVLERGDG